MQFYVYPISNSDPQSLTKARRKMKAKHPESRRIGRDGSGDGDVYEVDLVMYEFMEYLDRVGETLRPVECEVFW